MSPKVFAILCLQLVLSSGQQPDTYPSPTGAIKETIYDINLYISIPAIVIVLGLLLCLCYCCIGSMRDNGGLTDGVPPVIVMNSNSPVVVSAQSTSHNENGSQATSASLMDQINRQNTRGNRNARQLMTSKRTDTTPVVTQKTDGPTVKLVKPNQKIVSNDQAPTTVQSPSSAQNPSTGQTPTTTQVQSTGGAIQKSSTGAVPPNVITTKGQQTDGTPTPAMGPSSQKTPIIAVPLQKPSVAPVHNDVKSLANSSVTNTSVTESKPST